ncbi:MAG: ATP-binding protein [Rhodanobacteraceae bacterium]|nr:ATP-binding protein [Rhodanobacteraceae bacterium]
MSPAEPALALVQAVDDAPLTGTGRACAMWSQALDSLWLALTATDAAQRAPVMCLDAAQALLAEPRVAWLARTYELDDIDIAIVLIVAAPELDPRFGVAYGRLQGNAVARPAGPALCRRLLAVIGDRRLALRPRFATTHALFAQRILNREPALRHDGWCEAGLTVDPQILRTLLYETHLDPRLAGYCRLLQPQVDQRAVAMRADDWRALCVLARQAWDERSALHLQFRGPAGCGRRHAAEALAQMLGARLLVADLAALSAGDDLAELLAPLLREAWLAEAVLYVEGAETLLAAGCTNEIDRLFDTLADDAGITLLASSAGHVFAPRRGLFLRTFEFGMLDRQRRRALWRRELIARGHNPEAHDVDALAQRFRLTPAQISRAIRRAELDLRANPSALLDLAAAARAQAPTELAQLARKVTPAARWDDLVLPLDAQRQLRELCARVAHATRVLEDWGFDQRLSLGKGSSALFAGPSGTGKTMAAEIIAAELGLDLYKIDLATVVSKYIGETEKNLDRVFSAARDANAILLFDEADAIFGKRSEVRDSHDRYANLEVAYLLQKMEEFEGLAILSTNLKQNLDEAFLRRITYTVLFPFPDAADRERIWRRIWPGALPLHDNVDFAALAGRYKLSGGNIRNAAVAAAYFAAEEDCEVELRHVVHGVRRELQKQGKALAEDEISLLLPTLAAPAVQERA